MVCVTAVAILLDCDAGLGVVNLDIGFALKRG